MYDPTILAVVAVGVGAAYALAVITRNPIKPLERAPIPLETNMRDLIQCHSLVNDARDLGAENSLTVWSDKWQILRDEGVLHFTVNKPYGGLLVAFANKWKDTMEGGVGLVIDDKHHRGPGSSTGTYFCDLPHWHSPRQSSGILQRYEIDRMRRLWVRWTRRSIILGEGNRVLLRSELWGERPGRYVAFGSYASSSSGDGCTYKQKVGQVCDVKIDQ